MQIIARGHVVVYGVEDLGGHNTLQNHSEGFGRRIESLGHFSLYARAVIGKAEYEVQTSLNNPYNSRGQLTAFTHQN